MSSLSLSHPADTRVEIPTTTAAERPPTTTVEYDPLGVLLIRNGSKTQYTLSEFPVGGPVFDGRAFELVGDPDGGTYHLFCARNGQDSTCDCAGFTYTSDDRTGGRCKHLDAIRTLIEVGLLDGPRAASPAEPWPSPEQLAAQAGVDLPF